MGLGSRKEAQEKIDKSLKFFYLLAISLVIIISWVIYLCIGETIINPFMWTLFVLSMFVLCFLFGAITTLISFLGNDGD